jgi:hypothetical protein
VKLDLDWLPAKDFVVWRINSIAAAGEGLPPPPLPSPHGAAVPSTYELPPPSEAAQVIDAMLAEHFKTFETACDYGVHLAMEAEVETPA